MVVTGLKGKGDVLYVMEGDKVQASVVLFLLEVSGCFSRHVQEGLLKRINKPGDKTHTHTRNLS